MTFEDPFKADTSKFKELLNKDQHKEDAEIIDCETIQDASDKLTQNTIKGLPPAMFDAVRKAQAKLDNNLEKKKQVASTFNNLFKDLNQKYGLNVQFDFDSFTGTLNYLIEPKNTTALKYYLSETFSRVRVALYMQYLNAISLLAAQILDPQYLLSDSMTYDQKLETMGKLYEFMESMETVFEKVNVPDTEMKLEKLSSDNRQKISLDDPDVRNFMEGFFGKIKDDKSLENKNK